MQRRQGISPTRGRFFDEKTDSSTDVVNGTSKAGISEENYRLLVQQLVLCNDEIERLYGVERELSAENAALKEQLAASSPAKQTLSESPASTPVFRSVAPPQGTPEKELLTSAEDSTGPTLRPYLGVEVMDTGSEVVVKNILPAGGADEAGLQVNDILLKWNGRPIASRSDFGLLVSQAQVGSIVKLHVERGPKHQNMVLRVEVKGTTGPKLFKSPSKASRSHPSHGTPVSGPGGHVASPGDLERLNGALN